MKSTLEVIIIGRSVSNPASYYSKYKESSLRASRAYWLRNKEAASVRCKNYRYRTKYDEKYRKTELHKEHARKDAHRRRVGRKNSNLESFEYQLILVGDPCCFCGAPMEHIDHIDSIFKDGDDFYTNLTAACRDCNTSKNTKSLLQFLLERR